MPTVEKSSIIQIVNSDQQIVGAGFLVAKNTAVTCTHVIEAAGAGPGEKVSIRFYHPSSAHSAIVLSEGWFPGNDVAFLRVESGQVPPVELKSAELSGGKSFRAFGYPQGGRVEERFATGKIGGLVEYSEFERPVLQLDGQQIDRGLSGGPVWEEGTGEVVGMIVALDDLDRREQNAPPERLGYAIPADTLLSYLQSLGVQNQGLQEKMQQQWRKPQNRRLLQRAGLAAALILSLIIFLDKSWYRAWPFAPAAPAVQSLTLDVQGLEDLPADSQAPLQTLIKELNLSSAAPSKQSPHRLQIALLPSSAQTIAIRLALPDLPAYQLDFLPEIRQFHEASLSPEESRRLIEGGVNYSLGNYQKVAAGLSNENNLSAQILRAQAHLYLDQFKNSQSAYESALQTAAAQEEDESALQTAAAQREEEESALQTAAAQEEDESRLQMGAALAYWRQLPMRGGFALSSAEEEICQEAIDHYNQVKVTAGNKALLTNLKIIVSSPVFCQRSQEWDEPLWPAPGVDDPSATLLADYIASQRIGPNDSKQAEAYQEKLMSAAKQLNLARYKAGLYFWRYPRDCSQAKVAQGQLREAMFSQIDIQYFRELIRELPLLCNP